MGGWSLHLNAGTPVYTYNFLGLKRLTVAGSQAVPPGKATIRFQFAYDGGKTGAGGLGTIFVNGTKVGEGRVARTQAMGFSADEGADVGMDRGTPVNEDYLRRDKFTGKIAKVTVQLQ
jgi:arylsulfatase